MTTDYLEISDKLRLLKYVAIVVKSIMIFCNIITAGLLVCATILRYVFDSNLYGVDEIILLFAFWLYFFGSVYGSYENSHIKADIVTVYVKNIRVKDFITLIAQAVVIMVNLVFVFWAWEYFMWGLERMPHSTALRIPLVIPQSAIFFGLVLMAVYHIVYFAVNVYRYIKFGSYSTPPTKEPVRAEAGAFGGTDEGGEGGGRQWR